MAIITLTTDFGLQDEYVGVLKGVILSTAPDAVIVDITHNIEAQDIAGATQILQASYTYFPTGTIHMAVVDPGVGTDRAIIAAQCDSYIFLAPDNGLLTPILQAGDNVKVFKVDNELLYLHPVSRTFHGRDIFAPVAGHLSRGIALSSLGPPMHPGRLRRLVVEKFRPVQSVQATQPAQPPQSVQTTQPAQSVQPVQPVQTIQPVQPVQPIRDTIEGRIMSVDRFGNLITNVQASDLEHFKDDHITFTLGIYTIDGLVESYAQIDTEGPVAIIGSRGVVEIAINFGNASHTMNLGKGDIIRMRAYPSR